MADDNKQSGGRRIITQAESDALVAKAGNSSVTRTKVGKPTGNKKRVNRREFLSIATAGSLAVLTATGLGTMVSPNETDDLVASLVGKDVNGKTNPFQGGFAYPIIPPGQFGGDFILPRKADSYTMDEQPELNATGKFFLVRVPKGDNLPNDVLNTSSAIIAADLQDSYLIAIYQVCTHLGCLIPFQASENRFICPCHGSTFERSSNYVLGPAPRNLDQFPVLVGPDGTITVQTGKKATGATHA